MTKDELVELVAQDTISTIEKESLDSGMSLSDAAVVCREVASELRARADQFDEESGEDEADDE